MLKLPGYFVEARHWATHGDPAGTELDPELIHELAQDALNWLWREFWIFVPFSSNLSTATVGESSSATKHNEEDEFLTSIANCAWTDETPNDKQALKQAINDDIWAADRFVTLVYESRKITASSKRWISYLVKSNQHTKWFGNPKYVAAVLGRHDLHMLKLWKDSITSTESELYQIIVDAIEKSYKKDEYFCKLDDEWDPRPIGV